MNDTGIGAAPHEQDPAPAREEHRGAAPSLLDASRFEQALRRRGDRRDHGESDAQTDGANVLAMPVMPTAQPPLFADGDGDGGNGNGNGNGNGSGSVGGVGDARDALRGSRRPDDDGPPAAAPDVVSATAPAAPSPRPDVISPRDPAGAVTPPSPTLQALAQAGAAPRVDGQWRFEIDPQPLQQGLTLHAERLPPVHGIAGGGAPAWALQLHLPVALASSAGAAGRERLEQRLRRGGIALRDIELHARHPHHREENDDGE